MVVDVDCYVRAGSIGARVREEVKKIVKPGVKILDVATFIEKRITELGGAIAFPVNVGINEITAHYTPRKNDDAVIKEGEMVKIDFGVHVNGYIADLAFTYCSEKNEMVEANREILKEALDMAMPGTNVREIGERIEELAKERGYGVVANLTGHGLSRFDLHSKPTVPNVKSNENYILKDGDVIAIEPFLCEKMGHVRESGVKEIFSLKSKKPVRMREARAIMDYAEKERASLPFARRWLSGSMNDFKLNIALNALERSGVIVSYPVLVESKGRPTSQFEESVIVRKNPIVFTGLS